MKKVRRWIVLRSLEKAPRPFVVFGAVDRKHAERLYRAQNLIWVWLGIIAVFSAIAFIFQPDLGVVLTTHDSFVDGVRNGLFALGGSLIVCGIWFIRRVLEVLGHVFFAAGALINMVATTTLAGPQELGIATLLGLVIASAFRAYYITRWIEANDTPRR